MKIECPVADLDLKGANKMQMLGGIQTYARRYLYMAMFDITENDAFDAAQGKETQAIQGKNQQKEKPRNIAPSEKDELKSLIRSSEQEKAILKHYGVNT